MTSAYAGTADYERFMADLLRAKVKGRSPELRMLRDVKPRPSATSISPVLAYMEQVVTDLVGQHGCRHSIAHIGKLRELVDNVMQELIAVNASDERIELTHINSLRQNFICLNTTTVMQDGRLRWEFKDSRAILHDYSQQQHSGIDASASLPDIGAGNSVFDKLYSDAPSKQGAVGSTAESDESREEERKENAYVVKNLRSRLKKSEAATVSAENRVQMLEDGRLVQGEMMAKLKEDLRLLKMAHSKVKRQLSEARAELEDGKSRERAAEEEGRSDADQELREKRKTLIKRDQQIEKLLKETDVARTELKVMQSRIGKAGAKIANAEKSKEQMWTDNRRLKGALSDAQGLVRVLQESDRARGEGGDAAAAASDGVAQYGLRELAEKDRIRAESITISDSLSAEQAKTAALSAELAEAKEKVSMITQSFDASELRCRELSGEIFNLKCDLKDARGSAAAPEPEPEPTPQPSFSFKSTPKPKPGGGAGAARTSGSMAQAMEQGSPTSSSSSSSAAEDAYGAEDDFEDDEEEGEGEEEEQPGEARGGMTVDVDLGRMDDDTARDSGGMLSSKSLPSPISPIKRARENARMAGAGRKPGM
jgi:hypothetical protein